MKDDFFIGYSENAPKEGKKAIRPFLFVAALFIIIGGVIFGMAQNPFADSTFELTTETSLKGVYYEAPYPMLAVNDSLGERSVALLGFGKFGANKYIDHLMDETGDLNGVPLKISGNLIYYNDQTLIQITNKEKVNIIDHRNPGLIPQNEEGGIKTLEGEIVDPKCYFGVMKPGYGKIHRSCAARCISGGIPGVFVSESADGTEEYYIITDTDGKAIHAELVPFIGQPAEISGEVSRVDNWNYIKLDLSNIKLLDKPSKIFH